MDTIVLKFGGSSVSDNLNLNIVAQKIIEFKEKGNNVISIVSAQGKTTDNLIKEAKELSAIPDERELDALLSIGEQISASKLAILLNRLGHKAVSLTGWQAGILTNSEYQSSKILEINVSRINNELEQNKIVIITGFQGVDDKNNITTLGRGGSDTTAVAVAAAIKAKHCYIFSDVDGIYTADPRDVKLAQKLNSISYEEMSYISGEGAKVLHDRCVELAEKYDMPIIAASTFNKNKGTKICNMQEENCYNSLNNMEETIIKSIIKNDNIIYVEIEDYTNSYELINTLVNKNIKIGQYLIKDNKIIFTINKTDRAKVQELLDKLDKKTNVLPVTKISIVGSGISNHTEIIKKMLDSFSDIKHDIIDIDISACKISVLFNKIIDIKYLNELHNKLI